MKKPFLFRKRYIPQETVNISNDELLFRSNELLVTRWLAIKPRSDFHGGISYTFLKEGFKLSRFYDAGGSFLYWYCDIIDVIYDEAEDTYILDDLLLDIKIMPDGLIKLLDADELAIALERGLITQEQACRALKTMDKVLKMVYQGSFPLVECNEFEY
jgi:predicted RNA-binding protein associated with RNAse of E/G family